MRLITLLTSLCLPLLSTAAVIDQHGSYTKRADPLIHTADFDNQAVTSSDGFSLNLLHLARGFTAATPTDTTKVVYLQHGLFDSSDTWLMNGPENSLPYMLANAGYDVWMGNSRGNQYSPTSESKFSWDEMAVADLPAFLQTVREQTGRSAGKVTLIGHSQGAVEILASLIDGHVLPTEVSGVVTLGPPAELKNQQSQLFDILGKMRVDDLTKKIPSNIFTPTLDFFNNAFGDLGIPYDALFQFIFGPSELLEGSNFPNHFPAPTSGQNLAHWLQSARTGRFQHFEPDTLADPALAPAYDPAAIPASSVKIATFIGGNDFLATKADIEGFLNPALESQGNLAMTQVFDGYAHMDFTWSLDAPKTVYPVVMEFLKTL